MTLFGHPSKGGIHVEYFGERSKNGRESFLKGCAVIEIDGVPRSRHGLLQLIGGQEGCVSY